MILDTFGDSNPKGLLHMVLKSIYWIVFLSDCRTRRHVGCDAYNNWREIISPPPQLTPIKVHPTLLISRVAPPKFSCTVSADLFLFRRRLWLLDFLGHSLKMWLDNARLPLILVGDCPQFLQFYKAYHIYRHQSTVILYLYKGYLPIKLWSKEVLDIVRRGWTTTEIKLSRDSWAVTGSIKL